jgi:hypothetical protein
MAQMTMGTRMAQMREGTQMDADERRFISLHPKRCWAVALQVRLASTC